MALKRERGSNKTKGLCKLAIDEDMTIYAIDELKNGIDKELDIYDKFELNLEAVEEIDSAGIQLLLAFQRELTRTDRQLTLTGASGVVVDLIRNYGISDRFSAGDLL